LISKRRVFLFFFFFFCSELSCGQTWRSGSCGMCYYCCSCLGGFCFWST
jgi:hypothetical protein